METPGGSRIYERAVCRLKEFLTNTSEAYCTTENFDTLNYFEYDFC